MCARRLGGPFRALCPHGRPAERKQRPVDCRAQHGAGGSRRANERKLYKLRSILLAFALTGASAAHLYAPPVPPVRVPDHVATAWAHRYHIEPALAREIIAAAYGHGLDGAVAFRLVKRESSFRVNMLGAAGEVGLTQIKPSTARDLRPGITIGQLYEPDVNLDLGFAYLALLRARYHGDLWRAATAYNQGMAMADTLQGSTEYALELLGGPRPGAGATRPRLGTAPALRIQR